MGALPVCLCLSESELTTWVRLSVSVLHAGAASPASLQTSLNHISAAPLSLSPVSSPSIRSNDYLLNFNQSDYLKRVCFVLLLHLPCQSKIESYSIQAICFAFDSD